MDRLQVLPPGFRPFVKAERKATYIKIYGPLLIPGLVQTGDYATRVLTEGRRPDKFEELFAARMARQEVLAQEEPPWLLIVISEVVIRSIAAGREVMRGQLQRLLDLAMQPHVTLQVIPAEAPVFHAGDIVLLSFEDEPDMGFVDAAGGHGRLLDDRHDVDELAVIFDQARSAALSAEDSVRFVRNVMEEM
ncbi:DUF5753 domain-containing protein [Actinomadura sp. 6N118]|uniref:DUF5753 domain-containing protein n=1 Tax=Actinomadura sp. 6N118 TaxID=3375151 RepID=UPI0037ADA2A2